MKLFDYFKKKSNKEIEETISDQIVAENEKEVTQYTPHGCIITYIQTEDEIAPTIWNMGIFHSSVLPDIGSIIWIANEDTSELKPWKVIRFDFIEDLNIENALFPYIVVVKATQNDITDVMYEE